MDNRVNGLEVSQLESGQTFNFLRKAEQEGFRIDVLWDEDEAVLALPGNPYDREMRYFADVDPFVEQFVRRLQGGH